MKQFSPAGMATKGFYGGAGWPQGGNAVNGGRGGFGGVKNFGNPDGATSGGGAWGAGGANANGPNQGGGGGTTVQKFQPKLGTLFAGDPIVDIAIGDTTHAVIVSQNGNVGFSSDNGATWTRLALPIPAITAYGQVAVSADNTSLFVANGDGKLATSSDGGATWTDTTPAGANVFGVFHWPDPFFSFIAFDSTAAKVWTSGDGTTWTARATPLGGGFIPNGINNVFSPAGSDGLFAGRVGGVGVATYTNDTVAWVKGNPNQPFLTNFLSAATDGNVFNATGSGHGDGWDYQVFTFQAGTPGDWHLKSLAGTPDQAPFQTTGIRFRPLSLWVTGFDSTDFTSVASSPDGITWTRRAVAVAGFTSANSMASDGVAFYVFGSGILQSTDLATFTSVLELATGAVSTIRPAQSVFAVGSDDAGNGQVWTVTSKNFGMTVNTNSSSCPSNWLNLPVGPGYAFGGVPCGCFNDFSPPFPSETTTLFPQLPLINGHPVLCFSLITGSPMGSWMAVCLSGVLPQNAWNSVAVDGIWGQTYVAANATVFDNTTYAAQGDGITVWLFDTSIDPFSPNLFGVPFTVTVT